MLDGPFFLPSFFMEVVAAPCQHVIRLKRHEWNFVLRRTHTTTFFPIINRFLKGSTIICHFGYVRYVGEIFWLMKKMLKVSSGRINIECCLVFLRTFFLPFYVKVQGIFSREILVWCKAWYRLCPLMEKDEDVTSMVNVLVIDGKGNGFMVKYVNGSSTCKSDRE